MRYFIRPTDDLMEEQKYERFYQAQDNLMAIYLLSGM